MKLKNDVLRASAVSSLSRIVVSHCLLFTATDRTIRHIWKRNLTSTVGSHLAILSVQGDIYSCVDIARQSPRPLDCHIKIESVKLGCNIYQFHFMTIYASAFSPIIVLSLNMQSVASPSAPEEIPNAPFRPSFEMDKKTPTTRTFNGMPNRFIITDR